MNYLQFQLANEQAMIEALKDGVEFTGIGFIGEFLIVPSKGWAI